ncbi:MAG: radical SAM family heme chaperone HemW [Anaerolineales bacterium]|nr:radical SAM family heme chaperone HemW [Anaerolineales bacterium]
MDPFSLYLHIPFCRHRCAYCDFNTYAGLSALIPDYLHALTQEVTWLAARAGARLPLHSVYLGGGTPSLVPAELLAQVMVAIQAGFEVLPQAEITLEANPGTVSRPYLQALRTVGFNRLSLGMQSANPGELAFLERIHDYPAVIQAVTAARAAGFDNLSLDLIFGLPGQSLASWRHSLELALGLHPEHFSLYALTLEHGTPMQCWAERGLMREPDPDAAAEMYELASDMLAAAGYCQYEISNWARCAPVTLPETANPALAARHNLQYWLNQPYLGLGAGAHGYAAGLRTRNVLAPRAYIRRMLGNEKRADQIFPRSPATVQVEVVGREQEIAETMMMGLRLTRQGISARAFQARFGSSLEEFFESQISALRKRGLLEWVGEKDAHLRLTQAGRLLGNQVFSAFV